jgi:para-nitrobenzyl esterase
VSPCPGLPFVCRTLDSAGASALVGTSPPAELADTMHRCWIASATTGDPGWLAYDTKRRPVRLFGAAPEVQDDPDGALLAVRGRDGAGANVR